jgi:hypothetical protein
MSKLQQSTIDDIRELVSGEFNLTDQRSATFIRDYAGQPGSRDWLFNVAADLSLFGDHELMNDLGAVLGVNPPENGGEVSRFEIMRKLKDVTPEQRTELAEMAGIVKYELDNAIKMRKPELYKAIESEQKRIGTYTPEVTHLKDLSKTQRMRKSASNAVSQTFAPLFKLKTAIRNKVTNNSSVKAKKARRTM